MSTPTLLWFRQNLRLKDNPALREAAARGPVVPVFVLDQDTPGAWATGGAGLWWLHHSLHALAADLRERGLHLVLRRGRWEKIIPALAEEIGAAEVHAGLMQEPWTRDAEARIAKALEKSGRVLHLHRSNTLFDLGSVKTKTGGVYGVYTPFRRALAARGLPESPLQAPRNLDAGPKVKSDKLDDWDLLPSKPDWAGGFREQWQVGEDAAQRTLQNFLSGTMEDYERSRNMPAEEGTSQLSPHLHWGEISPIQAWHAAVKAAPKGGSGLDRFRDELVWHEFSAYLLLHKPTLPEKPMRDMFDAMRWRRAPKDLRAWQRGQTGVPIVDAGMRQLWHIGWMHNRVRMVVASFLIKHLLISWQDGEAWFWDTLVDGDLATNAVSWQWVAGCGPDAQPFFRVFNPVLQGQKFDPDGDYVRAWVPELARLPRKHIHAPWDAPDAVLREAGVALGRSYPRPIVDLGAGRDRALAEFKTLRQTAQSAAE